MSTRDNASGKKKTQCLNPASYTTTQKGSGVSQVGFDSLEFDIIVGAVADLAASPIGDGSWTFKAEESDTDVDGDYVAITDDERILITGAQSPVTTPDGTTGVFLTLDAVGDQNKVYHVGVVSEKKFVRIVGTAVTTPGASLLAIVATQENAALTPVTN